MSKEMNFVSTVIYVHNDEKQVGDFLARVSKMLEDSFLHYEIILVNDASTDRSVDAIKKSVDAKGNSMVQIVNMSYFHGIELAMNAGVDLAIGDFVYEIDSCVQDYSIEMLMQIYRRSLEGYDIVSAGPKDNSSVSSGMFYYLMNHFSDSKHSLHTERFRILSRRAINRIHAMNLNIPYRKALYVNCGLAQDYISYHPEKGAALQIDSDMQNYRWNVAIDVLVLFSSVGYKFALFMSTLMFTLGIFLGIYAVSLFFLSKPVSGWTSLVCVLSIGFSGVSVLMSIVIKYLDIVISLIFKRQNYIIQGIEKIVC